MRIIITGNKNFDNDEYIMWVCNNALKELNKDNQTNNIEILSDTFYSDCNIGKKLKQKYGVKVKHFHTKYDFYGKSAAYRGNEDIISYAEKDNSKCVLIAFWNGRDKKTRDLIQLANKNQFTMFVENALVKGSMASAFVSK